MNHTIDRRQLLRAGAATGGAFALAAWMPAWAQTVSPGLTTPLPMVAGDDITLKIARQTMMVDGHASHAIGINGTVPGPLIRLREGRDVRLNVINDLDEDSSVHWHGVLVPAQFDGVPGLSFPGIKPRSAFLYEFPIRQAGTYWYHSHSGMQEQFGLYGPIVIDPADADPVQSEREHVIVLSDHSRMSPEEIFRKMKQMPGYFNYQKQTLGELLAGKGQSLDQRIKWGGMRMDPTDISDVNGSTYTFLVNGHGPRDNWTALFTPGERVRLRIINASSMTTFNVRIPGLTLTIVQADGQNVRPVAVDEFQIGVAETYDVVVQPTDDRAYTFVGEAVDRSGMARATLTPRAGMATAVPALRKRPLATMKDMGMNHGATGHGMAGMDHTAMGHDMSGMAGGAMAGMGMGQPHGAVPGMAGEDQAPGASMSGMKMKMRDFANAPRIDKNPGVQTVAMTPVDRTGEPGQGLENVGHRVLVYRDLVALDRNPDVRAPGRSLDIHLTGNMERFMWSFDGVKMSDAVGPFPFVEGERVRVTLINDTMMAHPIHLHGHFFELVTGHGDHAPRKHTVIVQPGGTVSWDLTANALGDWAFHCHLLYHMMAGMM
ncbi:MAG: copper resistance system multicopper oxidase, partial [Pseudomonadota bacterium]|nr:copper resistance system multicopper oxidase [Pseudomonadota bacterium]